VRMDYLPESHARLQQSLCDPAQAFVERGFRHDLECGILGYGFARARCRQLFSTD